VVCGNSGASCYRNSYCDSGTCTSGWFSTGVCSNYYCNGDRTCYNTCYDVCLVPSPPPPPPPPSPNPPPMMQCNPHNCPTPYTCTAGSTCTGTCNPPAQVVCGNSGASCYLNSYCDSGTCTSGWFSTGVCSNYYCNGDRTCYNTCYDMCLAPSPPPPATAPSNVGRRRTLHSADAAAPAARSLQAAPGPAPEYTSVAIAVSCTALLVLTNCPAALTAACGMYTVSTTQTCGGQPSYDGPAPYAISWAATGQAGQWVLGVPSSATGCVVVVGANATLAASPAGSTILTTTAPWRVGAAATGISSVGAAIPGCSLNSTAALYETPAQAAAQAATVAAAAAAAAGGSAMSLTLIIIIAASVGGAVLLICAVVLVRRCVRSWREAQAAAAAAAAEAAEAAAEAKAREHALRRESSRRQRSSGPREARSDVTSGSKSSSRRPSKEVEPEVRQPSSSSRGRSAQGRPGSRSRATYDFDL
jgi:hypothetical protein